LFLYVVIKVTKGLSECVEVFDYGGLWHLSLQA